MTKKINDFVIEVATVNGSGSQSANNILMKSIFRMGIPVGGKNLFPSNIAGLPTWFTIRVNKEGFTGRRADVDIVVAMNLQTIFDDIKKVKVGGLFLYNSELKFDTGLLRSDVTNVGVNFRTLVDQATDQVKLKKLLANMIYVGLLSHLIKIDWDVLEQTIKDQFKGKDKVLASNFKALEIGKKYAEENLTEIIQKSVAYELVKMDANQGKIMIDGNTAAAMGMLFGGCTFMAWYPITPSSSVAENFISLTEHYRKDETNKNTAAIVQAEDELAAITMVMGAGWSGARAITTTSGPGMSLMAEASGLFYYAEIPGVIWNVQRVGPSTGLPTRTAQGDLLSAYYLSHGDTKHVVLLPGSVEECFEFGQTCFDLAERLQTLVLVLSDLDIGMNFSSANEFKFPTRPFDRGKVLDAEALKKLPHFHRYEDVDGDGIAYRTLPGTHHDKAAFFTRGTGHNEAAQYTESNTVYEKNMLRLSRKFETARTLVPRPVVDLSQDTQHSIGIIAFGSSDSPMSEARHILKQTGIHTNYLRLRALPLTQEVIQFIQQHQRIYVVEQNRDAQLLSILRSELPELAMKMISIRHFDGLPITALQISEPISRSEKSIQDLSKKSEAQV